MKEKSAGDRMFRNLKLMDDRIKDKRERNQSCAGLRLNTLHEAEELMRLLVARNAYDVSMAWNWDKEEQKHSFSVYVYLEVDENDA